MREHAHDGRAQPGEPAVHPPAVDAPVRPPRGSADVLALQRSAGNQAVGRWLAREADVEELDTGTTEKLGEWRVTVSKVGAFAATSVTWGGAVGEHGDVTMSDVTIVATPGAHSAKLMSLFSATTPVNVDVAHRSGFKLAVRKGIISACSGSGGSGPEAIESWTISPPRRDKRLSDDGPGPESDSAAETPAP
jgi:hypothetical protein